MKMCWRFTYPHVILDADEFVYSSKQIWKFLVSLAHQWILCSEWVPQEWESKKLIKTNNNLQVIHSPSVHQLTSCEVKTVFVRKKKSMIKVTWPDILLSVAFLLAYEQKKP